jgi:hypothetical protein
MKALAAVLLTFLTAAAASAERLSVPVSGVSLIEVRSGEARVFLDIDLPDLDEYAVQRAFLQTGGSATLAEPLNVWARASLSDGTAAPQVVSRTQVRQQGDRVTCDVTAVILGAKEGAAPFDGVLIALPDWRGEDIPESVAQALRTALTGATLEIDRRKLFRPASRP